MSSRAPWLVLLTAVLLPPCALWACSWVEPFPAELERPSEPSLEIFDGHGRLMRTLRTRQSALSSQVKLEQLSPRVVPALLAAEDARFFRHPGVDPGAILRAMAQAVRAGRVVSGASTLTQQLARTVILRPRTLYGKWREMAIALRIERELDKRRILEEYLSRIEFGPNLRGIEAASRVYFDKPASALSLAEAATLVALPQGPTRYDPRRGTGLVRLRRDRILTRLRNLGTVPEGEIERALHAPIELQRRTVSGGIEHLAQALGARGLVPGLPAGAVSRIDTTIDGLLQGEVEAAARRASDELLAHDATALSVLVVDNASSDVLAYLGSPRFGADAVLGQNDGVQALRQPGSTLKPFLYAAAMSELGMTPATLLPDLDLYLPEGERDLYVPKNYDRQSHGPVRLREALASSLNVPAVWTAQQLGIEKLLATLHDFGFESLTADATHYGAALALGDGEVRLSELVSAYAALARGGSHRALRYVTRAWLGDQPTELGPTRSREVLDPRIAQSITHMLSDREARAAAFGLGSALELPFPVAAKTGTSKGLRDNWTVGFTREVTVGVWVGNFDGRPLVRSSGVTGAGPLFREVMLAAMRARRAAPLTSTALEPVEICSLSGALPGDACPNRERELFVPGNTPQQHCSMHQSVPVVLQSGLRAGPACPGATSRTFERYPAEYAAWARAAKRPLAPERYDPRCPGQDLANPAEVRVVFPPSGARFLRDPLAPARQEIVLEGRGPEMAERALFLLDGQPLPTRTPFRVPWQITPGQHSLRLVVDGQASAEVTFDVL